MLEDSQHVGQTHRRVHVLALQPLPTARARSAVTRWVTELDQTGPEWTRVDRSGLGSEVTRSCLLRITLGLVWVTSGSSGSS